MCCLNCKHAQVITEGYPGLVFCPKMGMLLSGILPGCREGGDFDVDLAERSGIDKSTKGGDLGDNRGY